MTRISISIQVRESVDVEALGKWFEQWVRDQWDHLPGESFRAPCPGGVGMQNTELHLESVEAKPPASGRTVPESLRCRTGLCLLRVGHEGPHYDNAGPWQ